MTTFAGRSLGRYQLDESLGRGGMAEVWRALDTRLGREVAVKVVLPELAAEPEFRERFLREARLAAALDHPHVLPIYDFAEQDGVPYLVMPLIAGGTLAERLAQGSAGRPLAVAQVVAWVAQLGAALDAAHAAGVLHRDVKPGNVLIDSHGRALLADFGIAKLHATTTRLTRTGVVVGTATYMAPEVAAGGAAEAASDRYALAVIAYEMLAGRPPFEGENPLSILHQHTVAPVPPLSRRAAHLPQGVDPVLDGAMAKRPERRPPSCRRFVETLAIELGVPGALGAITAPGVEPVAGRRRSRRWAVAAGLVLLVMALVAAGVWVARRGGTPEVVVAPTPAVAAPPPAEVPARLPSPAPARPSFPPRGREEPGGSLDGPSLQRVFFELYGLERRATVDDYRRIAGALERIGPRLPEPLVNSVAFFAAGGLAYTEGRREQAEVELRRLLAEPAPTQLASAGPWLLLRQGRRAPAVFAGWQVALAYVDPLYEARAEIERALDADPREARLHLARAAVTRLDGDAELSFTEAETAWNGLAAEPELRSWAALLAAEAKAERGEVEAMLAWGERALEQHSPLRATTAWRLAQLAQRRGQEAAARGFRQVACDAGLRAACPAGGSRPARRLRPGG